MSSNHERFIPAAMSPRQRYLKALDENGSKADGWDGWQWFFVGWQAALEVVAKLDQEAVDVNAIRRVIAALAKRGCTHWVSCPDLGREPYCYVCAILADPAIRPFLEDKA